MIKHYDIAELAVAAEMIQMRMRIDHSHGMACQQFDDPPQISNAASGIDEHRVLVAYEQIKDGMLELAREICTAGISGVSA